MRFSNILACAALAAALPTVERRGCGDPVVATIDGKVVTMTDSWNCGGGSAPAASTPAPAAPKNQAANSPAPAKASATPAATSAASSSGSGSGGLVGGAVDSVAGVLASADQAILSALGMKATTSSGGTTVGGSQPNKWIIENKSSQDIIAVAWGPWASWVNANAADVAVSVPKGKSVTLTTKQGYSGGMSAIYGSSTKLVNGQISNSWLEFTTGPGGVVDLSKEVNMKGNKVSATISSSMGTCTTDETQCYFACTGDVQSCQDPHTVNPTGFQLFGHTSQKLCNYGTDPKQNNADTGGCQGFGNNGATVTVTWS